MSPAPRRARLWRLVLVVDIPLLVVGGLASADGRRWGGIVLVAYVAVRLATHLDAGRWSYLDVMRRPWPQVAPVPDDDWED